MSSTSIIAFSGGADSTALSLLEPDGIPTFTDTGWEFPETYEHIEKFQRTTGRTVTIISMGKTLPDVIRDSLYLPGHQARFCTRLAKIEPFAKYIKSFSNAELLVGIRADEDRTGMISSEITVRFPLAERGLNRTDVINICREHNLLPLSPPYMRRGGCVGCFYKRASEIRAMIRKTPEIIDELIDLEESVQDKRSRYAIIFPNIKMPLRLFRDAVLRGEQLTLLDDNEIPVGIACGMFCNR